MFRNSGFNVLFEGALMIGARIDGEPVVVDVARNHTGNMQCADFAGSAPVTMRAPGRLAAQEGVTTFTDSNAAIGARLGVEVTLHSWAFTETRLANTVFLRYTIRNTSGTLLEDLHAGLFFDWDIGPSAMSDYSDFDSASMTCWAHDFNKEVKTFVGATVLTRGKPTHFVTIANPETDAAPPVFGIHNGYTKEEKWRSLSSGIWNVRSMFTDISQVISNGPHTLQPGDSCVVAFALFAGLNKDDILSTTPHALDKWKEIEGSTSSAIATPEAVSLRIVSLSPHPLRGDNALLKIEVASARRIDIRLHDMLGRLVYGRVFHCSAPGTQDIRIPASDLRPGAYLLGVSSGGDAVYRSVRIR